MKPDDGDYGHESTPSHEKPLQSWKEIAAYLDRAERTARRWERTARLPVHRLGEGKGSSVYAYRTEIDAWRATDRTKTIREDLRRKSLPVAAVILGLILVAWFIKYGPILNPPNAFVEAATGITVRDVLPGGYSEGGPSPDGRSFVFIDWGTGNVAIEDIATGERKQLTDEGRWEEPEQFPMWAAMSPDGTRIAYTWFLGDGDRTELRLINSDGSNQRTLLGTEAGFNHETVSWSSDGKQIATRRFGEPSQIIWVSAEDGSIRVLATLENNKWLGKVFHSPDNRYLAYSHTSEKYPPNHDVFMVATDGSGETIVLVEHLANERVLGWIPGRDAIVFLSDRSGTWDVWLLEVREGRPWGDPERVYTNLGNVAPLGFTDDGSFYYEVYSRWLNNYVTDLDPQSGKPVGPITQPLVGYNQALDWSPDGRYLAYSPVGTEPEGPGIFAGSLCVRDLQSGEDRVVPTDLMGIFVVRWSPTGSALLVGGFREREVVDARIKSSLFSVDPKTGVTKLVVERPKQRIMIGEWAPGGKLLYFIAGDSVVSHELESGRHTEIYRSEGLTGLLALSNDGERLAAGINDADSGSGLVVIEVSTEAVKELPGLTDPPTMMDLFDWSPDGRHLYYLKAEEQQGTSLWRIDTKHWSPERLWQTNKRVGGLRIHPSGRQIAFAELTHETSVWVMDGFIPGSVASK